MAFVTAGVSLLLPPSDNVLPPSLLLSLPPFLFHPTLKPRKPQELIHIFMNNFSLAYSKEKYTDITFLHPLYLYILEDAPFHVGCRLPLDSDARKNTPPAF